MNLFGHHDPTQESELEYLVRAMSWLTGEVRDLAPRVVAIEKGQTEMTQKMDDFKAQLAAFITKLDAFIAAAAANQANSDALVAAAVAKEQAGEDVDVQGLSDALAAEAAKVPDAPTPPAPPPAV